jgi:hypothetical protein
MSSILSNNQGIFPNSGQTAGTIQLRSYRHASRVFGIEENFARIPKVGFLYYVKLNVNTQAVYGNSSVNDELNKVGLLCKKIDLPKFELVTETINQYNRKTVIQTQIKYSPVIIEFHDDNSDITTSMWKDYYQYYYADSNQADAAFGDTKFGSTDYSYGLDSNQTQPFFNSIDVYVLHQQRYTKITMINPTITAWRHDTLDTEQENKTLSNIMTVVYENVKYDEGTISSGEPSGAFTTPLYDQTPSPIATAGNSANSRKDASGQIPGSRALTGQQTPRSAIRATPNQTSPSAGIDGRTLEQYKLRQQGKNNILHGNSFTAQNSQPGSAGQLTLGGTGISNSLGINLPQSVNNITIAKPVNTMDNQ